VCDWIVSVKLRGTVVVRETWKNNRRENGKHNTKQQK
jgi:hypothetical protein